MTLLGSGAAALVHKVANLIHTGLLECGSEDGFQNWRYSVRSMCTDQGVEKAIPDAPNILPGNMENMRQALHAVVRGETGFNDPEGGALDSYLFPVCIGVPDSQHICFNALESAIKSLPDWKPLESQLQGVALIDVLG